MIIRRTFRIWLLSLLLLLLLSACKSRVTDTRPTPTSPALRTVQPQTAQTQTPQVQPPQPQDQPVDDLQVQPPEAPQLRPELPQIAVPQPQDRPGQAPQPRPEPVEPPLVQAPQVQPPDAPQLRPEPPPPAEIRLDGIWASQDWTDYGTVTTQMILQKGGNYSYQVVWGELMTYEVGIYEPGEGFIHFAVEDYQPKQYKGTELSRPTSWTVFYTVVDEDTMIWEDRILGSRWTVHRQR